MENIRRPLGPYRLAQKLKHCQLEKEALEKQVEELKAELQSAENHKACQEEKLKQHTTKPEGQMIQTESLHRQVEDLKNNLLQEKSRPQDEVKELNDLLGQEHAKLFWEHSMRQQLSKELEKTKEQLAHQKSLKEMFINKEKKTRCELERLKTLSATETMEAVKIVTEVGNNIKTKQEKVLQKHFEELKVAHIISQKNFSFVLQGEKDKNKALQQELEQLKVLCQINLRYETELKSFFKELEDLKEEMNKQTSTNQELITKLQAAEEANQGLQRELAELKEEQKDKTQPEKETPSMIYRLLRCWWRLRGKA